ncbi:hypothetical protein [Solitalea koreensis]|nr:hypothetical protein [Solitalea koreensis]
MEQQLGNKPLATTNDSRYILLPICIIMDLIGMSSFTVPIIGEAFDVFWAPISAVVFFAMFKRKLGVIGGAFSFLEEILPGTDIIPTFTIAWILKYLVNTQKTII